ncbi:MAG: hypothetical protein MRJ68_18025 [Nitrospira sp.]|nr:hypothetical protein [Nitrospira sp.]
MTRTFRILALVCLLAPIGHASVAQAELRPQHVAILANAITTVLLSQSITLHSVECRRAKSSSSISHFATSSLAKSTNTSS